MLRIREAHFKEFGLEIEFDYGAETDGVALVGANELPFAVVSGEQVVLARAQEIPVVYVFAWWQEYPVAVTVMADKDIRTPADLRGKKIGLPGLYGASYVGLRALLDAGDLAKPMSPSISSVSTRSKLWLPDRRTLSWSMSLTNRSS